MTNRKIYIHVDNGGYTFAIENGKIVITDGYFGYSEHKLILNCVKTEDLVKIGNMFLQVAAEQMVAQSNKEEMNYV